jgi:hypothetical protein
MNRLGLIRALGVLFIGGMLFVMPATAQVVRPHYGYIVSITDPVFIKEFITQQTLPITTDVDSLVFIDADGAGFGENDLVTAYPSKQTFPLSTVEEPIRSSMTQWSFSNPNQVTSPRTTSAQLFQDTRKQDTPNPLDGMLAFILKGLELYYTGTDMQGRFRQDSTTVFLEIWDFDPKKFRYREAEGLGLADTVQAFDLLHILRNDTLFLTDSTLYDVIYVYKTYTDTVYLPQTRAPEGAGAGH